MNLAPPRHSDRLRHTADPPEPCPARPDQRIRARRLITENLQVTKHNPVFERDTVAEIGQTAGVHRTTVYDYLNKEG
jgi:hypothetical protein